MNFVEEDFQNMMWDIYRLSLNQRVFVHYKDLQNIFIDIIEISKKQKLIPDYQHITIDKLVRYIVYTYHKYSPLVKNISNVNDRKKHAMVLAGVELEPGNIFPDEVLGIMMRKDRFALSLILRFLKFENDRPYATLAVIDDAYYTMLKELGRIEEVKDIPRMTKELDEMKARIDSMARDVFAGESDLANALRSFEIMEDKVYKIAPEQYAGNSKISGI